MDPKDVWTGKQAELTEAHDDLPAGTTGRIDDHVEGDKFTLVVSKDKEVQVPSSKFKQ